MLFLFFASTISFLFIKKPNYKSNQSQSYSSIVDFSSFQPEISIKVLLFGFQNDNSFTNSFGSILERFLSIKKFGIPANSVSSNPYINVSLKFSVQNLDKEEAKFYERYQSLIEQTKKDKKGESYFHIQRDSEFTSIFSNLHAKEILRSSPEKYTLFFINNSKQIQFKYEDSKENSNCVIFEFNSGFCHIGPNSENDQNKDQPRSTDKNFYISQLFKYTSIYVEQIIIPDLLDFHFLVTPSKIVVPIVTFGPEVKSLSILQKEVVSLFSPVDSLMIANRQNLYEFPIVATALQAKFGSSLLFTALGQSEHIFGTMLGSAILENDANYRRWKAKISLEDDGSDQSRRKKQKEEYQNFTETVSFINRQKVTPIYVFSSPDDKTSNLYLNLNNHKFHFSDARNDDNNCMSAIFASDDGQIDKLLLSSIARVAGNINFLNNQNSPFSSTFLKSSSDFKKLNKKNLKEEVPDSPFGGHHPFAPYGGACSFSSLFSDAIIRNFALSNILVSYKNFIEATSKLDKLKRIQLPFLNSSLKKSNLEILQKLIVRTSDRINKNEISKALSSSSKAAEVSFEVLEEANNLVIEASVFGNCCPETVYISNNLSNVIVVVVAISFFGVVIYALYKLFQLFKKKRFTPIAFL